MTLAGMEAS